MDFKTLEINNYQSIGHIEYNLSNQGVVLVVGKNLDTGGNNGAGKSSFLGAIAYALYGKNAEGHSSDDVINNKVGKDTSVILTFDKEGHSYKVARYRKDKKYKNKVLVYADGEEISKPTNKDNDLLIESIVGISFQSYMNSIFFGGQAVNRFSSATDKERKELLEDITNISVYQRAHDIAKDKVQELEKKLSDIKLKQSPLETTIEVQTGNLARTREKNKQNKAKADEAKTLKESLDKQIEAASKEHDYGNYESVIQDLVNTRNTLSQTKVSLVDTYSMDTQVNGYKSNAMSTKSMLNSYISKYKELLNTYQQTVNEKHGVCSLCGQVLDEKHKRVELEHLKQQGQQELDLINQAKQELGQIKEKYLPAKKSLDEAKQHNQELQSKNQEVLKKVQEVTAEIDGLNSDLNKYKDLIRRRDTVQGTIESYSTYLDDKEIVASIKQAKEELATVNEEYLKVKSQYQVLKEVSEVFSNKGVKSHVMDLIVPFLNEHIADYLSVLSNGTVNANISTTTTTKKGTVSDTMTVNVDNTIGGGKYDLNSSGEKKRINLAISLALQDYVLSKSTYVNVLFYDEVFENLDEEGCEAVMSLLNKRVKKVGTIFVVSHSEELKGLFEKSLVLEKKDGITSVR